MENNGSNTICNDGRPVKSISGLVVVLLLLLLLLVFVTGGGLMNSHWGDAMVRAF